MEQNTTPEVAKIEEATPIPSKMLYKHNHLVDPKPSEQQILDLIPQEFVEKFDIKLSALPDRLSLKNDWDMYNITTKEIYEIEEAPACLTIRSWHYTLTLFRSQFVHFIIFGK